MDILFEVEDHQPRNVPPINPSFEKLGDIYVREGYSQNEVVMCCQYDSGRYVWISLSSGNRWLDPEEPLMQDGKRVWRRAVLAEPVRLTYLP